MFNKQLGWAISLVAHLVLVGMLVAAPLFASRSIVLRAEPAQSGSNQLSKGDRGITVVPKMRPAAMPETPPPPQYQPRRYVQYQG